MPRMENLRITKAWRYRNEPDRVHYMLTTHDGGRRHLFVPNDSALGRVLDEALRAQNYVAPANAAEAHQEDEGIAEEPTS